MPSSTYYERNAERIKARSRARYAEKREEIRAQQNARYATDPEPQIERARRWALDHSERRRQISTESARRCRGNAARPPAMPPEERARRNREARARYAASPVGRKSHADAQALRRARLALVPVERVDRDVVYDRDAGICGICREPVEREVATLDHIVPLALGGAHLYSNVQIAHRVCNSRKGARVG